MARSLRELSEFIRGAAGRLTSSNIDRFGERAPTWLEMCAAAARVDDPASQNAIFDALEALAATSQRYEDLRRILTCARTFSKQQPLEESVDASLELRLLYAALGDADRLQPQGSEPPPRGTHPVRLGLLLVSETEGERQEGRFGQLVLTPLALPGARGALVRHPHNLTQVFHASTLDSFAVAHTWALGQLGGSSVVNALEDVALVWSVSLDSDAEALKSMGGASASVAMAVAILMALRTTPGMPRKLRTTLGRIRPVQLASIALSAEVTADGEMRPIHGLTQKIDAWLDRTATPKNLRVHVASEQEGCRHESRLHRLKSVPCLIESLADSH